MRIPPYLLWISAVWTIGFWSTCVALPVVWVVKQALGGEGWGLFFDPSLLSVVQATVFQAFWSTAISGVLGLPLGLWIGRSTPHFAKTLSQIFLSVPYGVPTVVAAMAWVLWIGRTGILAQMGIRWDIAYSLKAVVLAHVFFNIPLVALWVAQARSGLIQEQLEAAQTLGARPWSVFRWMVWPQIRWPFLSVCAQVLALCSMSFALVLILGGGPPVQTLETEIYSRLRYGAVDISGAAASACWELLITLLPWILILIFQYRSRNRRSPHRVVSTVNPEKSWEIGHLVLILVTFLFILPYFCVLDRQTFAWIFNAEWRARIIEPLRLSVSLAAISSFVTVLSGLMATVCMRALRDYPYLEGGIGALLVLPSGISVLVLSLGVWLAYGRWIDPFDGSWLAMIALQVTLFFPLAFRIFWPLARGTQVSQLEAATSLGASTISAFWHVEWPRWKVPILSALVGVAGASLSEVGAVSLFYSEQLIPLPLLISRWMSQYRFDEAKAVAGILFLLSSVTIVSSLYALSRFNRSAH
jgi:thiamine transport system permease protein